jgi:uncharacterized protein YqjF (DUF2071 family)
MGAMNAGTQSWRKLLFLHWTIPVDVLRALVPAELELDLFAGEAFVGVVPFAMERVRPWWLPRVAALDFLETNVRTYVTRNGQRGVYFFSLEAASRLAVAAARATFGLPYWYARMSMRGQDEITYETVRAKGGARHFVRYRIGAVMQKGDLEEFLVERYVLFVKRGGKMLSARVKHVPYPLRSAELIEAHDELIAAAGMQVEGAPRHVCFSDGVDVEVFAPTE